MTKTNSVSIFLRERLWHPLVGDIPRHKELDSPLSCMQGKMLADAIEEMWEFVPEEKRKEIKEKMDGFNQLGPETSIEFRNLGRRF